MGTKALFAVAMAGFCMTATVAQASPLVIFQVPIADVLGHREAFYYVAAYGNERNVDKAHHWFHGLTVGLYNKFEVGYDNDTLGNTFLHGKVQFYQTPKTGKIAISGGVMNVGVVGTAIDKYLVGRYDLKACRLHAGVYYNDRARFMMGVDCMPIRGIVLQADHISGPFNVTWAGVTLYTPIQGLVVSMGAGFPAEKFMGIQHQINVSYGLRL